MVHIYVDKIKVITREGRVLILSYEEKELEDFILWQVSSSLTQIVTYFKSIRHWEWFHVLLVLKYWWNYMLKIRNIDEEDSHKVHIKQYTCAVEW